MALSREPQEAGGPDESDMWTIVLLTISNVFKKW
jgi:hypothetical protein